MPTKLLRIVTFCAGHGGMVFTVNWLPNDYESPAHPHTPLPARFPSRIAISTVLTLIAGAGSDTIKWLRAQCDDDDGIGK